MSAPVRVLALSSLFPHVARPYAASFVEALMLALHRRVGIEVKVVAPMAVPPVPLRLVPRLRNLAAVPTFETWRGLDVWRPRFPAHRLVPSLAPAAMTTRLLPLLRRIREGFPFDLIDAQTFWPDGVAAMRLARALAVPYSVKARGEDIDYWGHRPSARAAIVAAGRHAGLMLAVSERLRAAMADIGLPAERIVVHYTGLDRERFRVRDRSAAKARLKVEGPLLLSVGNLIGRKGHAIAIEAAARLPGVNLWIAGGGPHGDRLKAQIEALGIEDRVRLLGHVPHAMLPALLAAADVTVLASSEEGLANVWVESLACGTPVVTTDVGGAREVIDRPAAGRIVARDPEAIAAAVAELLRAPPSQEAVSAAAERFGWDSAAAQLDAHYRRLLGRDRTS